MDSFKCKFTQRVIFPIAIITTCRVQVEVYSLNISFYIRSINIQRKNQDCYTFWRNFLSGSDQNTRILIRNSISLNSLWHRASRTTRGRRMSSLRTTRPNISRDLSTFSTPLDDPKTCCCIFLDRRRQRSSALEVWEYLINSNSMYSTCFQIIDSL